MSDVVERRAARALVTTPEREVLLMQFRLPWRGPIWITPGGGLEGEEDARTAVVRELREETGLVVDAPGPALWHREHLFVWEESKILQRETYFWIEAERFEPRPVAMEDGDEIDWFVQYRWWPVDALPEKDRDFAPEGLGALVRNLLRDGAPAEPFEIPV